jgi:NAD(P)-dependent dehydrogenase (short-subunit alcohol dehydrogenase family)
MPRTNPSFRGRTVLVTGASSGIGREAALAFSAAGANVVLVARRAAALARVAKEARAHGVEALSVSADVASAAAVEACFARAVKRFGGVDIVVNNAGVMILSTVEETTDADLRRMLDVNLFGALHVMQQAMKVMRSQGHGSIVNVASLAGRRGFSPLGGYCATKFGLVGLTEALRMEIGADDIHVALVLPGVVDTPLATNAQRDPRIPKFWPERLNMPASWVVQCIFLAIRFRLTEIAVPPGTALLEKLAALAPGAADTLLRGVATVAQRAAGRRSQSH